MKSQITCLVLLSALFVCCTQGKEETQPIQFSEIANILRDPTKRQSLGSLLSPGEIQERPVTGAGTHDLRGAKVSKIRFSFPNKDHVRFGDLDGDFLPVLFAPPPDPETILLAKTLDDLLAKFLPAKASKEMKKHLLEANDVAAKNFFIGKTNIMVTIGAFFVDNDRLVGIKCRLYYPGLKADIDTPKIDMINMEIWYSAEFTAWK